MIGENYLFLDYTPLMAEGENKDIKPIDPEQIKPVEKDIDIYSPEITERVIKLIRRVDMPEIMKEHLIENIDKWDRAQLIQILWRYFERVKKIQEGEEKDKRELEEAQRHFLDALELDHKYKWDVW